MESDNQYPDKRKQVDRHVLSVACLNVVKELIMGQKFAIVKLLRCHPYVKVAEFT